MSIHPIIGINQGLLTLVCETLYIMEKYRGGLVEQRWLTVKDIAKELGVEEDTVRDWIRRRELAAYRVGREFRIKIEDYERFLEKRRIDSKDDNT